ncbi:MAG: type 4a pilus biogenesis protein PilO [Candidatus Omnitrophica bacterium]|nr:type 4a pilus biogenesis protein PilO [Candidatus Omnitrophota bacterium]
MKWMPSIRPREFRLAVIAGGLIGCWGAISLIVQPLWDRTRQLHLEIETQAQRLKAVERLLEQAPAIEEQYRQIEPYLRQEEDATQVPFLNQLQELSKASDVRLSMKPRNAKQEGRLSRYEVELDLEGSQEQVLAFLDAVLRMPKLLTIERLRLVSAPTREQLLRANLVIQKLTLH